MTKSIALLFLVSLIVFPGCQNEMVDNNEDEQSVIDKIEGTPYSNDEIGWTMTVPTGWEVMSKDILDQNMKNGQEVIEKTQDANLDYSGLTHLINFKKDNYNQFLSSIEPFDKSYAGEWEENNALVRDFITETFEFQGIPIDTSSHQTQVDGLTFEVFNLILYRPDGMILMYEDMYSRYINGYDFSIIITYDNTTDKVLLEKVIRQSKFSVRT